MKRSAIVLALALAAAAPAFADVDINLSANPQLVPVPGYPVYYAPDVDANYFYYDDQYWDFDGEDWYSSVGYDGPWDLVPSFDVPIFLLDVPVRYYRHPPGYFHGWRGDGAPHWREHWGAGWNPRGVGREPQHRADRGGHVGGGEERGGEHGGGERFGGGQRFGGGGEHFGGGGERGGGGGGEHGGR